MSPEEQQKDGDKNTQQDVDNPETPPERAGENQLHGGGAGGVVALRQRGEGNNPGGEDARQQEPTGQPAEAGDHFPIISPVFVGPEQDSQQQNQGTPGRQCG